MTFLDEWMNIRLPTNYFDVSFPGFSTFFPRSPDPPGPKPQDSKACTSLEPFGWAPHQPSDLGVRGPGHHGDRPLRRTQCLAGRLQQLWSLGAGPKTQRRGMSKDGFYMAFTMNQQGFLQISLSPHSPHGLDPFWSQLLRVKHVKTSDGLLQFGPKL